MGLERQPGVLETLSAVPPSGTGHPTTHLPLLAVVLSGSRWLFVQCSRNLRSCWQLQRKTVWQRHSPAGSCTLAFAGLRGSRQTDAQIDGEGCRQAAGVQHHSRSAMSVFSLCFCVPTMGVCRLWRVVGWAGGLHTHTPTHASPRSHAYTHTRTHARARTHTRAHEPSAARLLLGCSVCDQNVSFWYTAIHSSEEQMCAQARSLSDAFPLNDYMVVQNVSICYTLGHSAGKS